jgi:putative lipoprotein
MTSRRGIRRLAPVPTAVALASILITSSASAEPPAASHGRPIRLDPWWGPDKALHFSIAALLAGGGYALGSLVTDDKVGRVALGADLALSAVLAKEAADEAGLGTASWRDFTWGVLGTGLGVSVSLVIDLAVPKSGPRRARWRRL